MDPLELVYDDISAVPEAFRDLYTEQDGKHVLTGINGLKTQADVDYVRTALSKERDDHKATRESLKAFGDLKPDEVRDQLARIPELEAKAGKVDDEAIEKIVSARLNQRAGPIEADNTRLSTELETVTAERDALRGQIIATDRDTKIRSIAGEMKAHPTAIPDIEAAAERMLERTEDGKWIVKDGIEGVTPGNDYRQWLKEMQKLRPHWWPESEGGGAGGGKGISGFTGKNPWSADTWNLTEQGNILRQDKALAERLAKAAGTAVGAGPAKKK